jgi:hypothetical protein
MLLGCRWAQSSALAVLLPSFQGLSDSRSTVAACAAVAQELSNITPNCMLVDMFHQQLSIYFYFQSKRLDKFIAAY